LCFDLSLYSRQFFLGAAAAKDGQAALGLFPSGRAAGFERDFE
jgi:hypothetical protein